MTDMLSPSPYAYLDALPPADRQAEIARRQHQRREEWCDNARRARDYQAAFADLRDDYIEAMEMAKNQALTVKDALSRIAELEAALEPFADAIKDNYSHQPDGMVIHAGAHNFDMRFQFSVGQFRAARAALRK